MAKPGQSSFRRILLSRLLLLSVPVLLAGVYVTYRKARSALLETARHNVIESAVRKSESIEQAIAALRANLVTASEALVLQSQSSAAYQRFINQLAQRLPTEIQCVQLTDLKTNAIAASTCGEQMLIQPPAGQWFRPEASALPENPQIYVTTSLKPPPGAEGTTQTQPTSQLQLVLSAPVYNAAGQLHYALSIQSALLQPLPVAEGSLFGRPVVINQAGTILAHPYPEHVGDNIAQEADARRLKRVLRNAIAGERDFQHLFAFEKDGVELLAGYSSIESPITTEENQKWIILAVTPLDNALYGLREIQQVLVIMTCGLIVASFLATLYVARDLARPLEKLRDYALHESQLLSTERIPQNFKIRELNQMSEAFEGMIERLRDWAEELETAWKEAQTANQLKNEFLANTSHELRTPLNGIIGCLRLVRDGFCDDREEELDFLQRADDAAIHLLAIINDVLDIAKIEAGKLSVETEPLDLRKLLNEVINLQAVPIQQKGLQFHTTPLTEAIAVRADPAKLKQVLLNVVGNAVKFTDTGSITITTRIEALKPPKQDEFVLMGQESRSTLAKRDALRDEADLSPLASCPLPPREPLTSQVVMSVKDTGIGIDSTQQHKLFRPFVMVDGSTTRKCGGAGLGLAISRNLMELMGGSIDLFSDGDGQGTTVEITLPTIEPSLLLPGEPLKSGAVTPVGATDASTTTAKGIATPTPTPTPGSAMGEL